METNKVLNLINEGLLLSKRLVKYSIPEASKVYKEVRAMQRYLMDIDNGARVSPPPEIEEYLNSQTARLSVIDNGIELASSNIRNKVISNIVNCAELANVVNDSDDLTIEYNLVNILSQLDLDEIGKPVLEDLTTINKVRSCSIVSAIFEPDYDEDVQALLLILNMRSVCGTTVTNVEIEQIQEVLSSYFKNLYVTDITEQLFDPEALDYEIDNVSDFKHRLYWLSNEPRDKISWSKGEYGECN